VARFALTDFSGGLNLRDSTNEIAPNETPDATNWTLDERGAAKWRNGCSGVGALPGTSGKPVYLHYSEALSTYLCARESAGTFKLFTGSPSSWTDRGTINSVVTTQAAFVDFPGNPPKVVIATDISSGATKGMWTWDGTTLSNVSTTIAGRAIALWQDRVIVAGYSTSDANGNPTRFLASAPKDPTTWTLAGGAWNQDVREKDATPLTALGIVGGGLIVFKKRSAYRVNDSANGSYTMIDPDNGCIGPRALTSAVGRIYAWGSKAICEFDGVGRGRSISDKVNPIFDIVGTIGGLPLAGTWLGRAYFAYPTGADGPHHILEYDPEHQWLMRHQVPGDNDPIAAFSRGSGDDLKFARQQSDLVYTFFNLTPGEDNSVSYASISNFRTPWLQLNGGGLARLQRARVQGLVGTGTTTTLDLKVYKDWDRSSSEVYAIGDALRGGDASDDMEAVDLHALGHSKSFQFEVVPGTAPGNVKLGGLHLDATPLAR
jgi:hypothetical protein